MRNRRDPDDMSLSERIAELEWFIGGSGTTVEVPFEVMHERIEKLMGRPVWTHEFAEPVRLVGEARRRFAVQDS
jgi:hypothetical protein